MSEFEDRKRLTFEQAEGAQPIPGQLALKELSEELRARLWAVVFESLRQSRYSDYGKTRMIDPWLTVLFKMHVYRHHRPADEFHARYDDHISSTKKIFTRGDYLEVFGWLQWVLRARRDNGLLDRLHSALEEGGAAYRLLDDDETIVPISSEQELSTLKAALADLSAKEFGGARAHLTKAAQQLTVGQIADSIRESIHAVESVVRVLEPHGDFSKALARLESKVRIHGALKSGFTSIYGFTSDEKARSIGGASAACLPRAALRPVPRRGWDVSARWSISRPQALGLAISPSVLARADRRDQAGVSTRA
jgi:hypothetical protein